MDENKFVSAIIFQIILQITPDGDNDFNDNNDDDDDNNHNSDDNNDDE